MPASGRGVVVQLVLALLAAGLLRFIIDLRGSARARRLEAPEREGLVTKGAESAVLSLKTALDAAERREARLEAKLAERDVTIAELREEVHRLVDELHGFVHRPRSTRARASDAGGGRRGSLGGPAT